MIITGGMTFSGGLNLTSQAVYYYQPETYSNSTVLLLQADKSFYYDDTSVFNTIITAPGFTSATSFVPSSFTSISPSDGSGSFPGTAHLLSTTNFLGPGTGNFTIECWFFPLAAPNAGGTFILAGSITGGFVFGYQNATTWGLAISGGAWFVTSTTLPTLNVWNHLSVTRNSGTAYLFLNGALLSSAASSQSFVDATTYIGHPTPANTINGYLSNLRIIHGRALYTGAFAVPTQALTLSPSPLDASNYSFDLAASSYVSTPNDSTLAYGTADFTIECWFRLTNATSEYRNIWGQNSGSILRFGNTGFGDKLQFAIDQSSVANVWSCAVTASSVLNTWTHVAWTRTNGENRLYVNGVLQSIGSGANPATYPSTSFTNAGSFASPQNGAIGNLFVGQISNFRITNGHVVYSGNFTPPTNRLTATQSTGTNNIFPITSLVQPYSVLFNGSSNLTIAAGAQIATFGTGAFTVELWLYMTSTASTQGILYAQQASGAFNILFTNAGGLTWGIYGNPSYQFCTTANLPLNRWFHLAVSRVSNATNQTFGYINGVLVATATDTNNYTVTGMLIGFDGINARLSNGRISNLRIVNGLAVYTGSFTPPTSRLTTTQGTGTNIAAITKLTLDYGVSFNGSSQYLIIPYNSGFNIPTNTPVCFEAWVYTNSSNIFVMANRNWSFGSVGSTWAFYLSGGVTPTWGIGGTGQTTYGMASSTLNGTLGQWNHYAFTRDVNNVVRIFVNGQVGVTRTDGQAMTNASGGIYIGVSSNLASGYANGYMSNIRFVLGSAVYTGNFTPPTSRLLTTQAAGTNIAAIASSIIDYSILFNSGQSLSLLNNAAFDHGTGNFTIEVWAYWSTAKTGNETIYEGSANQRLIFGISATGIRLYNNTNGEIGQTYSFLTRTWYHIAIVRIGTTITFYVNGTSIGTASNATNWIFGTNYIGRNSDGAEQYLGFISNFRIVKGTAVYTGNFTPPTSRLLTTQAAGTNIAAITTAANSVSFNGTSQYLTIPSSTALQLVTATPFAIEAWIYSTNMSAADHGIIGKRQGGNEWQLNIHPSFGHLNFWNGATTYQSNTTLVINTWYHVAVTWDATTLRFFVNGVMGSTYTGFTISASTNQVIIGGTGPGASGLFAGYISNLRIVKGSAVYTANFAVPTGTLPVVAGASLLTLQSATFVDNSVNAHVITPVGSPVINTLSPFGYTSVLTAQDPVIRDNSSQALAITNNGAATTSTFSPFGEGGSVVLLTAQDPVIQDNSVLASSISNVGAATASIVNVFGGTTVLLTAQDPVIQDNSVLASSITNTGAATTSTQNPFGSTALLTAQDTVIRDNSVNATVLTTTGGPGVSPLTPFGVTTLLTLQSNAGDDNNNIENFARIQTTSTLVNKFGTVTPGSFSPFSPTVWSNYFNTGDKLTFPSSSAFDLSGSTWTVEFWMYSLATATAGNACRLLMAGANGDAGGWSIGFSNDGVIGFGRPYSGSPTPINSPAGTIALNTWYHVAFVCNAGSARIYINGTQAAGPVTISLPTSVSQTLRIGYDDPGTVNFQYNGYISNLRIVKEKAIYTGNFTPPSSRLSTSHSAGTNIAAIKTTPDYSVLFNGTSQHLEVAANNVFAFGTGNFTVEGWFYNTSFPGSGAYNHFFDFRSGGASATGWTVGQFSTAGQLVIYSGSGQVLAGTINPVISTWNHFAVARVGSTVTLYLNGISIGTWASSTNFTDNYCVIGRYAPSAAEYFAGYLSNLRIVKGSAVYTGNFTVPTDTLPVVAGTSLLTLQSATLIDNSGNALAITPTGSPVISTVNPFGGTTALLTCQSNRFIDNSINALAPTVTGTPVIVPFSPLPQTDSYNASVHGSSLYFSGGSSYLNFTQDLNLYQLSGDFTIEAFVYATSLGAYNNLLSQYQNVNNGFSSGYNSSSGWYFGYRNNAAEVINFRAGTSPLNNWTHVVFVKSGTTMTIYINGTALASTFTVPNLPLFPAALHVGIWAGGIDSPWVGYISNLRLVNGAAVYTSAFTPPTLPLSTTAQTVVLLNGNSAGIIDSVGKNSLTTVGGAKLNHTIVKYGTGSIAMTSAGDYCVAVQPSVVSDISVGDFTIEFWVYFTSLAADRALVSKYGNSAETAGGQGYAVQWVQASSVLRLVLGIGSGSDALYTWSWAPSISTWYHVAVTRAGTSGRAFVNGTQIGSTLTLSTANSPSPNPVQIGKTHTVAQYLLGYMDELRISRIARYTANFTAPTAALSTGTYIQIA